MMQPEDRDPRRYRVILTRQEVPAEQMLLRSGASVSPEDAPAEPDLAFSGEELSMVDGRPFMVEFTMPAAVFADLGSPEEVVLHIRGRIRQRTRSGGR